MAGNQYRGIEFQPQNLDSVFAWALSEINSQAALTQAERSKKAAHTRFGTGIRFPNTNWYLEQQYIDGSRLVERVTLSAKTDYTVYRGGGVIDVSLTLEPRKSLMQSGDIFAYTEEDTPLTEALQARGYAVETSLSEAGSRIIDVSDVTTGAFVSVNAGIDKRYKPDVYDTGPSAFSDITIDASLYESNGITREGFADHLGLLCQVGETIVGQMHVMEEQQQPLMRVTLFEPFA